MPECLRPQVEEEFVALARVNVDSFHGSQIFRVGSYHTYGVVGQPPLPHLRDELSRGDIVGEVNCTVRAGRVAGGHTPVVQQVSIALPGEGWTAAEIFPEFFKRTCI